MLLADVAPPDEPMDTTTLLVVALVALAVGVTLLLVRLRTHRGSPTVGPNDPEVAP
jgi:hypothetical protein